MPESLAGEPLPHDERIALCNFLMREHVAPRLPGVERAVLMVFPAGCAGGSLTYISNAQRGDMHKVLRRLLAQWDARAAESSLSIDDLVPDEIAPASLAMFSYRQLETELLRRGAIVSRPPADPKANQQGMSDG